MTKKAKLKLHVAMSGYKKGDIVKIEVDDRGVPLDRFWFRRLKDSKLDHCVEFLVETHKGKSEPKAAESEKTKPVKTDKGDK
jgi:bifunctional DNA-binding transcriptional regulator/antitoxin component of YhaV-PrlF toxin-antitoxin module